MKRRAVYDPPLVSPFSFFLIVSSIPLYYFLFFVLYVTLHKFLLFAGFSFEVAHFITQSANIIMILLCCLWCWRKRKEF